MIAAYTGRRHPGHPIHQVTEALNSEAFLELGRKLTGDRSIRRSDVQASFYRPGDFLNLHDDTGPGRAAAFTIGLSRGWRPDWGGQLLFHDADGDVVRGFAPRFNALTVFRVPRAHSVAPVAGYAQAPRLSVVGWWRTD